LQRCNALSDPIQRLARLDARRHRLDTYIARVKMAFWMPTLQKRMLHRLHAKLRQVGAERSRVLNHINADPVLRKHLRAQEQRATQPPTPRPSDPIKQHHAEVTAHQQRLAAAANDTPLASLPKPLRDQAATLVALNIRERHAKTAYQQGVWYYKSRDWQAHSIPVEDVGALLCDLRAIMRLATTNRVIEQESFEDAIRALNPHDSEHIILREKLLAAAPQPDRPSDQKNAFQQWAEENIPRYEHEPTQRPQRRRRRGR
jgi:hypothetical protein